MTTKGVHDSMLTVLSLSVVVAASVLAADSYAADLEDGGSTSPFRQVYIPVEDLDVLFKQQRGVLLERAEFDQLWEKARAEERRRGELLEDVVLADARYQAKVANNALQIEAQWTISKQVPGWRQIPIPLAGVSIAAASIDGNPARIGLDDQGKPTLFLVERGVFELKMTLATMLDEMKAAKVARFHLPPVPGKLVVQPPAEYAVEVGGRKTQRQGDVFEIAMGGRGDVQLAIVPERDSGERPTVLFAEVDLDGQASPAQTEWTAAVRLQAFARPVSGLTISLPVDLQVVAVEAPGLADWEVTTGDGSAVLAVRFAAEWLGERALTIRANGPSAVQADWRIPGWRINEAASQTGSITFDVREPLSARVVAVANARRLPAPAEQSKIQLAYWSPDYDIRMAIAAKARQLAVGSVTSLTVQDAGLELVSSITVEPRNGILFDLVLLMKSGWYVRSIRVDEASAPFQSLQDDGVLRLQIDLPKPVRDGESVALIVEADRVPPQWLTQPDQPSAVELTTVQVEGADETEGVLLVRAPETIRVQATATTGLESTPTAGVPGADDLVRLALRYRDGEVSGTLQARRKPARVGVETHAVVVLRDDHLLVDYDVTYTVNGGTTNRLAFELPDAQGQSVLIQSRTADNPVAYQADQPLEDGRRRWTLRFQQEVTDSVQVAVRIERPREGDQASLPVLTVDEAARQSGTVAVEGGLAQEVTVEQQGLRPIDPSELPARSDQPGDDRLVASFQYARIPYSLSLAVEKHPIEPVLTAFCSVARLETVLDDSGHARHRAVFTLRNQGMQKLAVTLPEQSKLLSARLNGQAIEVHRQERQYLLSLPPGDSDSLEVEVFYQTSADSLTLLSQSQLQTPQLNLPILEVVWTVYVPDGKVIVATKGPIAPSQALSRFTILGALRELLMQPGGRRIFNPLELFAGGMAEHKASVESAPITAPTDEGMIFFEDKATDAVAPTPAPKAPLPAIMEPVPEEAEIAEAQPQMQTPSAQPAPPAADDSRTLDLRLRRQAANADRNQAAGMMGGGFGGGFGGSVFGASQAPPETKSRGLLSLSLALDPVGTRYNFRGLRSDSPLQITIQDRVFSQSVAALVAVAVVLLGWLARRRSRFLRSMFIALCLSLAVGLSGLVSLGAVYLLDGLFLGGLALWGLYFLRAIGTGLAAWARPRRIASATAVGLLLAFGWATDAHAAEPPAKDERPKLFIPYAASADPLESTSVYLPKSEYDRLRALAFPDQLLLPDPATAGAVSTLQLAGKVEGETARFDAELTLWCFRDDWVELPVPLTGVIFSEVLLDGQPAKIAGPTQPPADGSDQKEGKPVADKPPFPVLYVRGRGEHLLKVRFDVPVERRGVTGRMQLRLGAFAAGFLKLELPEDGVELQPRGLTSGWQLDARTATAAISPRSSLLLEWAPPDARRAGDVLANVEHLTRAAVAPDGVHQRTQLSFRIIQGAVDRWEIAVPQNALVRDVRGAGLADWWLKGEADSRTLVVTGGKPWTSNSTLDVDLFLPSKGADAGEEAENAVQLGSLVCQGVRRESGEVLLVADATLQVNVRSAAGYQEVDPASIKVASLVQERRAAPPMGVPQRTVAAYRFVGAPRDLTLAVEPIHDALSSRVEAGVVIRPGRTELEANIHITKRGTPLVATQLRLPAGFAIEAVESNQAMRWSQFEEPDHLLIEVQWLGRRNVDKNASDSAAIRVHGWVTRANGDELAAPAVEVVGAESQRGVWAVFLSPGLDAQTIASTGLRPMRPTDLPRPLQQTELDYVTVASRLAFEQQAWPASLQLRLTTLQPRVESVSVTVVSVRELAVANIARLVWRIEQAGVRTLQFSCPSELGEDLSITGPGVRQVESEAQEGDRRVFRVTLDRPYLGEYQLQVVQTGPLPEDGVIAAPDFVIENTAASQRYVVLENLSPDQLDRVQDPDAAFEQLEIGSVPINLADPLRQHALEVLRIPPGSKGPVWKLQASEQVATAPASVNLVDLLMVVDETGAYRAQANFRVSNKQEQFLALEMPTGAAVWSLYVAGKPSRPSIGSREEKQVLLVPLPRTAAGDFSSVVELVYTGELDQSGDWIRTWSFPSPLVIGLPVAHTQWTMYLPEKFNYTMIQGNMEEAEEAYLELNRQSATFQEAFNLVAQANYGKGSARERARSNLFQLGYDVEVFKSLKTEKSKQLLQRTASTAQQLREAVEQLRQQPAPTTTAARQVQLNQYFAPVPTLQTPIASRRGRAELAKEKAGSGPQQQEETVRSRLKERVELQVEALNRGLQEQQFDKKRLADNKSALERRSRAARRPEAAVQQDLVQQADLFESLSGAAAKREGGLSVRIELPKLGQPLHFAKARGNPILSMQVYPAKASQDATAWVWLGVVVGLSLSAAWWIGSPSGWRKVARHWAGLLLAFGLVWWLALPVSPLGFLLACLAVFLIGARWIARRFVTA